MGLDNPMDIRIVVKRNLLGIVIIVRAIQEVVEMNPSQRIPYTGTGLNEHGDRVSRMERWRSLKSWTVIIRVYLYYSFLVQLILK